VAEQWQALLPDIGATVSRRVTPDGVRYSLIPQGDRPASLGELNVDGKAVRSAVELEPGQRFGLKDGPSYVLLPDASDLGAWRMEVLVCDADEDRSIFIRRKTDDWQALLPSIHAVVCKAAYGGRTLYFIRADGSGPLQVNGQTADESFIPLRDGDEITPDDGAVKLRFQADIPVAEGDDDLIIDGSDSEDGIVPNAEE
jgi:hypothetical protein